MSELIKSYDNAAGNVEGATRPILADITVIKFKNKTKPELYSFYLKTGKAPSLERTSS